MKTLTLTLVAAMFMITGPADAQLIQQGPNGWTLAIGNSQAQAQVQTLPPAQTYPPVQTYPTQQTYPPVNPNHQTFGPPQRVLPPHWALPQHPVIVTGNRTTGWNPYTGGTNTANEQVENTYFDPNRNAMRNNGSERFVQRPVYNEHGQIVGYERGYVWRNTITGAEHHELKTVTDNGQGGTHEQTRIGF